MELAVACPLPSKSGGLLPSTETVTTLSESAHTHTLVHASHAGGPDVLDYRHQLLGAEARSGLEFGRRPVQRCRPAATEDGSVATMDSEPAGQLSQFDAVSGAGLGQHVRDVGADGLFADY